MIRFALMLFVGVVCVSGWAQAEQMIRVLSYNIHHGEGLDKKLDLDRIAQVVKSCNPDVVCLQEIDRNQKRSGNLDFVAELEQRLAMKGVFESNYDFGGGQYGNATFTRFEIVSHKNHPLPVPPKIEPRGCLETVIRVRDKEIRVLNTHWGLDTEQRRKQSAVVASILAEKKPTLLAGDFNEHPDAPGISTLASKIGDALTAKDAKVDVPESFRTKRIDYIFVSGEFAVREVVLLREPPARVASDHLPLFAEVAFGE